jgi:1-acyl-sn-glycerol-3-phosphate acyltransferase
VTVSNHASTMDDPFLFCAMLPWRFFATESTHRGVRWTLCANDICHQSKLMSDFFRAGKTLPIVRGGGAEQPILRLMAERLREHGDWLHVFPEGRVRQDGQMNKLKSGLAHVLCGVADAAPIVLPFHHRGMEEVLRVKTVVPHTGKLVHVVVGEPIEMADLLQRCRKVTSPARALTRRAACVVLLRAAACAGVRCTAAAGQYAPRTCFICSSPLPASLTTRHMLTLTPACSAAQKGEDQQKLADEIMQRVASSLEALRLAQDAVVR